MTKELPVLPETSSIEDLQVVVEVQHPPFSSLAIRLRGLWTYLSIAQANIERDMGQSSPQIVDVMNELADLIREVEEHQAQEVGPAPGGHDHSPPDRASPGDTPEQIKAGHDTAACLSDACRDAVVLPTPAWLDGHENGVCVDGCISATVAHIWSRGIQTLGSCSGHGATAVSLVLAESVSLEAAVAAIAEVDQRDFVLYQWRLVELTDPSALPSAAAASGPGSTSP